MRGQHGVGQAEQRVVGRRRFALEDIEGGDADFAVPQGVDQRRFVDQPAARGVDDGRLARQGGERLTVDYARGRIVEGRMEGEIVGVGETVGKARQRLAAEGGNPGGVDMGVEDAHPHAEGAAQADHEPADAPLADDDYRLSVEVAADDPAVALPLAGAGHAVEFEAALGGGEHEIERVFGDRARIGVADRGERNASFAERRDIHRIEADPVTGDDLQPVGAGDEAAVDPRGAHDDGVGGADGVGEGLRLLLDLRHRDAGRGGQFVDPRRVDTPDRQHVPRFALSHFAVSRPVHGILPVCGRVIVTGDAGRCTKKRRCAPGRRACARRRRRSGRRWSGRSRARSRWT